MRFTTGDLFESNADALVNTVNCVGVMGRGVALQFKKAFPANFAAYAEACERGEVRPGRVFVFETGRLAPPSHILNFPTKRHWRSNSRLEDIEAGLVHLRELLETLELRSVAVPPLGSGLGGLRWRDVRPRIEAALAGLEGREVIVYEPGGGPSSDRPVRTRRPPEMTDGRAALVSLMHTYLGALMDPEVTLLEVHKLLYFQQLAGEPLRLRFARGPYGPYAENLRHVLHAIEGHLVSGYEDGGDRPGKVLTLVDGALDKARRHLDSRTETRERLERVAALVEGFESPFGLELLATVHMVLAEDDRLGDDALVTTVHGWSERKRMFDAGHIRLARERLAEHNWTAVSLPTTDRQPARKVYR